MKKYLAYLPGWWPKSSGKDDFPKVNVPQSYLYLEAPFHGNNFI